MLNSFQVRDKVRVVQMRYSSDRITGKLVMQTVRKQFFTEPIGEISISKRRNVWPMGPIQNLYPHWIVFQIQVAI